MIKKHLLLASATLAIASLCAPAFAQDVSVSVSADVVSEYVFRGVGLGAESFQPGIEASLGNFTAGAWYSTAIGDDTVSLDELDLYGSYGFDLSETLGATVGATLYHYPDAGDLFDIGGDLGEGDGSTFEVYAGLTYKDGVEPSLTLYYDTSLEYFTLEGTAGTSLPLGESGLSLDPSITIGAVDGDGVSSYQYGALGVNLTYPLSEAASVYAGLNGAFATTKNFVDYDDADALADAILRGDATLPDVKFDKSTGWLSVGVSYGF